MRKTKVSLPSLLLRWRKSRNFHHFNDPVELLFLYLLGGDSIALGFHTQYVPSGTPSSSLASEAVPLSSIKSIFFNWNSISYLRKIRRCQGHCRRHHCNFFFFICNGLGVSLSSEADELKRVPSGTYYVWKSKATKSPPRRCKKSNSTGSSKWWKFCDFLHWSNNDDKDTFVFLTPHSRMKKKNRKGSPLGRWKT